MAQVEPPPATTQQPQGEAAPQLKTLIEDCDAHKFETVVESVVDGQPHRSKVKLCGVEGQSDAGWIGTLKDAIAKLEANEKMAPSTREQIITAVKAEIGRLEAAASQPVTSTNLQDGRFSAGPKPLTNDYTVLPPLPNNPPPRAHVLTPTEEAAAVAGAPPADAAPPETAKPVETAVAPPVIRTSPVKPPAKPRLTISCIGPEFPAGGECVTLTRDTVLRVKAGEDIPAGITLRFLRSGGEHGELELGSLRKGRSINYSLPAEICAGVVSAEVLLSIVRSGQQVDRRGPFLLHC
jgi:hypothetical protein